MVINLLSQDLINQIAAGEVIENPSAVIKELVENSIDAKSSFIEVDIEDSGLKKIVVKDDGCGISKDDLLLAPIRHATSKIKDFNDLYSIKTMGFRGEALASIFSVSKARIVSSFNGEVFEISSNDVNKVKISSGSKGTLIEAYDLFYNTPARKKYLKSESSELRSIVEVMNRYCVYYYDVKFVLKHNGKVLINKPSFKTEEENLYYFLGKDLRGKLLFFENEIPGIKISGFLGKPSEITYPYVKNQMIYVNERFVKSKIVRDAIYEGFNTNLMSGRHPFFVVFVDIDPEIVDVNVHPTKIEIRFENELEIFEFVKRSVKDVFEKSDTIKPFEEKKEKDLSFDKRDFGVSIEPKNYAVVKEDKSYFSSDVQKSFDVKEDEVLYKKSVARLVDNKVERKKEDRSYGPLGLILQDFRVVGVVNKTYVILETKAEMFLFDFHAVAEKVKFERLMNDYESKDVSSQKLLKSFVIDLDRQESLVFDENKNLIEKLGFVVERFGDLQVVVRAVPIGFSDSGMQPELVKEILHSISVDKKFVGAEKERVEKLARMSCRSSIKAGYEISLVEIKRLIEELRYVKEPFNCPHGRPTMLRFDWQDLEKRFKRIV